MPDAVAVYNPPVESDDYVSVQLVDHRNRKKGYSLPLNKPIAQVKERIIKRLEASSFDPSGQPVVYDLVHRGRVLTDRDTLAGIGVVPDDEIELSPSIQSA